jgi:Ca2+-binding RTX toxin-like protein
VLSGLGGNDTITGGPGSDLIEGGTGVDTCTRDASDRSPATSCTDLAGPVLDLPSVQWISATVLDNSAARALRLRVHITDDRSGIAAGSGAVVLDGDNEASVVLEQPRLVSGTANDGVWEFVGTLPKYAPTGEWHIYSLQVSDRVNHQTAVYQDADLPGITVTSGGS